MPKNKSENISEKNYAVEDYKKNSTLSKGLATTHEQASDTLVEGTIDGVMENVAGKDIPLEKRR